MKSTKSAFFNYILLGECDVDLYYRKEEVSILLILYPFAKIKERELKVKGFS